MVNKKFALISFFILFFALTISVQHTGAVNNKADDLDLIDKEGTYDVPNHPNLKVKVFIHRPRDAKPIPSSAPLLVCPGTDPDSSAVIPATGWRLPSNWTYTLNTTSVPSTVGSANWTTIAGFAFSEWATALNGKATITKTSANTTVNRAKLDKMNILAWGRTSGTALAVTYTWYYPSTGLVAEVDTIMNQKFPWFWYANNNMCTDQNSYDAQNILTHELGHWMGLDDVYSSNYLNNTMYGFGSKGETKKDTLTSGDVNGITAIYH